MIKAIIIDDEQHCINALKADLAKNCPNVEVIGTCNSGKEGVLAIKKFQPHLIFLDIEMPWMNGFEMLEMFDHIDFCIIFTTAYDKFAAKAFRISAVDYLLKPVDAGDLKIAVQKAEEKITASSGTLNIQNLLHNIKQPAQQQKIALPNKDGYEFVDVSKIIYAEALGSYTSIVLADKSKILVSKPLGDIEEILPEEVFIRIHHSTLINQIHVTHFIRSDGAYVVMSNGEKLIVSRAKKEILLHRLGLK